MTTIKHFLLKKHYLRKFKTRITVKREKNLRHECFTVHLSGIRQFRLITIYCFPKKK